MSSRRARRAMAAFMYLGYMAGVSGWTWVGGLAALALIVFLLLDLCRPAQPQEA